jgi:hypothetical protein
VLSTDYCVCVDIFLFSFENRDFLYELNAKCDYARKCRRKFRRKFHGNAVPKTTGIHTLIKRVTTTGLLLESKAAIMHSMLTEEKLDEIGVRLEHTAQKSQMALHKNRIEIVNPHLTREINLNLFKRYSVCVYVQGQYLQHLL